MINYLKRMLTQSKEENDKATTYRYSDMESDEGSQSMASAPDRDIRQPLRIILREQIETDPRQIRPPLTTKIVPLRTGEIE